MGSPLYTPHGRPLTVLFSDLENHALAQRDAFVGTAGSVIVRENASGFRLYAHQFYDGDGKKRERYLGGPVGSADADARAEATRARIRELKELVPSLRLLGREGFNLVDPKTYATIASLHNHGVFAAGGMLIGSHAYGVLLNRLGARAAAYSTEDIDIARREALAFPKLPEVGFLEMLRDSGVELQVATTKRGAHDTGLPYLRFLLEESQEAALLAREGCCAVRVPLPERFAIHKVLVSRLRVGRGAKAERDLRQAATVCAVLGDSHPGALEDAVGAVPRAARKHLRAGLAALRPLLEEVHPRAWEELKP